ncbi:FecR family protein [Flavihumibacter solisilvae]|uniref:FecR protein domain-containing protein n=1 Tax=Flavihumibacter solisilvae TaxID=1349421 RepID=A0A0C1LKW3_9BACT|nr:FecR domain-containing protein [Flavihumibacter solisilvae]KIC95993.1 hypothetical protein OI18_02005 [Flavihumibacter solisilvae]
MDKDKFLLLATKVLSGSASPEEEMHLEQLLSDPQLRNLYDQFVQYWQPSQQRPTDLEQALAHTWEKIGAGESDSNTESKVPVRRLPIFKKIIAAAAIVLVLVMAFWIYQSSPATINYRVAHNANGVRSTIVLPDGSKVWLGADSRLKYPELFTQDNRTLELDGEAFFEVVKNPEKPFIINMKDGAIRVLGTSFNVKAYSADGVIVTSVATGKVAFVPSIRSGADSVFLTPGRKASYRTANGALTVSETDASNDRAWIDGVLNFESETLSDIARTLSRYYGKQIVFRDNKAKQFRYTGKFSNSSAAEILRYLGKTKPFSFKETEDSIYLFTN